MKYTMFVHKGLVRPRELSLWLTGVGRTERERMQAMGHTPMEAPAMVRPSAVIGLQCARCSYQAFGRLDAKGPRFEVTMEETHGGGCTAPSFLQEGIPCTSQRS